MKCEKKRRDENKKKVEETREGRQSECEAGARVKGVKEGRRKKGGGDGEYDGNVRRKEKMKMKKVEETSEIRQ